jgi:hypothetical protein
VIAGLSAVLMLGAGCGDPQTGPRAALESARYVVTADIGERVGTADFAGVTGNVYSVSTVGLRVWKGDDVGVPDLRVLSTPATDGPAAYPRGDPLSPGLRRILFLTRDAEDGMWRTLSVSRSTLPDVPDATLPEHWPPGG